VVISRDVLFIRLTGEIFFLPSPCSWDDLPYRYRVNGAQFALNVELLLRNKRQLK